MATELKTYSFTDEDMNLITFALRMLHETSGFGNVVKDCKELIAYIERLKKENATA